MCLTRAAVHGHLSSDRCLAGSADRAEHGGHLYSDKAPGLSFAPYRPPRSFGLPPPPEWHRADLRLWAVRASTGGIALLLCALLLGRVSEGLAPRLGRAATLVTFASGTLAASLAVDNFDHVPAAALGFAAFVLAWKRRPVAAGLAAGCRALRVPGGLDRSRGRGLRRAPRRPLARAVRRSACCLESHCSAPTTGRRSARPSPLLPLRVETVRRAAAGRLLRHSRCRLARGATRARRESRPARRLAGALSARRRPRAALASRRFAPRRLRVRRGRARVPRRSSSATSTRTAASHPARGSSSRRCRSSRSGSRPRSRAGGPTLLAAAASVVASTAVLADLAERRQRGSRCTTGRLARAPLLVTHGSSPSSRNGPRRTRATWIGAGRLGGAAIVIAAALLRLARSDGWRTARGR